MEVEPDGYTIYVASGPVYKVLSVVWEIFIVTSGGEIPCRNGRQLITLNDISAIGDSKSKLPARLVHLMQTVPEWMVSCFISRNPVSSLAES